MHYSYETDPRPTEPFNGHDFDHPDSKANRLKAGQLAKTFGKCPHCNGGSQVLPMHGSAWGVEHYHRQGCINHEDFAPAPDIDLDAWRAEHGGDDA